VTRWRTTGTNIGQFQGRAPTGRQATVLGIFINRVVGGRITETWSSFDRFGLAQQLRSPEPTV
jgi:predicted ester cyclase